MWNLRGGALFCSMFGEWCSGFLLSLSDFGYVADELGHRPAIHHVHSCDNGIR